MLDAETVQALTSHPVGGVCPFGLATPLPVYCDLSLQAFDEVVPPPAPSTAPCASPRSTWPNWSPRNGWTSARNRLDAHRSYVPFVGTAGRSFGPIGE